MFRQLCFNNFKSFKQMQQVPLRQITLIYGMNSAGKSSILQILRLLSTAVQNESTRLPFDDPEIALVSHSNVTHRRNRDPINVSISFHSEDGDGDCLTVEGEYGEEMSSFYFSSNNLLPRKGARLLSGTLDRRYVLFDKVQSGSHLDEKLMFMSSKDTITGLCQTYRWPDDKFKWFGASHFVVEDLFGSWMEEVMRASRDQRLARRHDQALTTDIMNQGLIIDIPMICENLLKEEVNPERQSATFGLLGLALHFQLEMSYQVRSHASVRELGLTSPIEVDLNHAVRELVKGHIENLRSYHTLNSRTEVRLAMKTRIVDSITEILLQYLSRLGINSSGSSRGLMAHLEDLQRNISRIRHLGPTRQVPTRYDFAVSGKSASAVRGRLDPLSWLLGVDPAGISAVNQSFETLGIPYSAEMVRFGSDSVHWMTNLQSLILRDKAGTEVSLPDVGYGISQVLPILLEIQTGGCLLIEQPELHLHPALQAELAEEIVKAVRRTGGQVIMETHSEHMVLRLQKMIRHQRLSPDEVAILVVTSAPSDDASALSNHDDPPMHIASTVQVIELDEFGTLINPWPPGFFDTTFNEIFDDPI